jgi:hypothetical protein
MLVSRINGAACYHEVHTISQQCGMQAICLFWDFWGMVTKASQSPIGLSRRRPCEGGRGVAFRAANPSGCRRRKMRCSHGVRRDAPPMGQRLFTSSMLAHPGLMPRAHGRRVASAPGVWIGLERSKRARLATAECDAPPGGRGPSSALLTKRLE